jgi:hypothetical protein
MSFNRLSYDTCQYKQVLCEATGPGQYVLNTPKVTCEPCFTNNPNIRLQKTGQSVSAKQNLIDINSELLNITRPNSKCPSRKFLVNCDNSVSQQVNAPSCEFPTDETRTSNPPSNLRGTGWNRWETLCKNPQNKVLVPFDFNIQNRLIVKDNHRPCIPTPIDVNNSLPKYTGELPCPATNSVCGSNTHPPSVPHMNK